MHTLARPEIQDGGDMQTRNVMTKIFQNKNAFLNINTYFVSPEGEF